MPSGRRARPVLVVGSAVVVVVAAMTLTSCGGPRSAPSAQYTAQELRERPDLTQVLPDHVEATRALLEAVGETAAVTWEPADPQVFVHERDGADEQVVDGRPALSWKPEHWDSAGHREIDDASREALARTFREVLEARGFDVATNDRTRAMDSTALHLVASTPDGASLQLLGYRPEGRLRVIALTSVHLYDDAACDPDPLMCVPTVEDPLAGR